MSKLLFISVLAGVLVLTGGCQTEEEGTPLGKTPIHQIQQKISADSIEARVKKISSFQDPSKLSNDSAGTDQAREWVYNRLKKYSNASDNRLKVAYDRYDDQQKVDSAEVVNVIAVLPGTQLESKDRTFLVSSSYNSRMSEGRDDTSYVDFTDDAASLASVMELARVMSNYEFDATLIFAVFDRSGQGVPGAQHFAEKVSRRNINISAMISNNVSGLGSEGHEKEGSNTVDVFAQGIPPNRNLSDYHQMLLSTGGENDTPSRQLGRYFLSTSYKYANNITVNMIYRRDRYRQGGDHVAFLDQGYPAVRVSDPSGHKKHQNLNNTDNLNSDNLPDQVDYTYVSNFTRLNASLLSSLANAPAKPSEVIIKVEKSEMNTSLQWKSNVEPDLKGYEIVWRQTHESYWQDSVFVGDTTAYTIQGVSNDNNIFGLRAVDQMGHKSLVRYPEPSKNN